MIRFCSYVYAVLVTCVFLVDTSNLCAQEYRTWTSANGQHQFDAELVSVEKDVVTIKGRDGKKKTMKLSKLSKGDQKFLADVVSEKEGGITKAQKEMLKEFGLRFSRDGFSFLDEKKLRSEISKSEKTRRSLTGMEVDLREFRILYLQAQNQMVLLRQKHVQLNKMLATPGLSTRENNQIVGQVNAIQSQMELLQTDIKNAETQIKKAQSSINEARDEFVQEIMGVRKLADSFGEKANALKADEKFEALSAEIEETLQRKLAPVGESKSMTRLQTKLKKLESIVLTDTIKLIDDGSGTFEATVSINGLDPIELVVDSGASVVTIPTRLAEKLGIEVGEDAKPIRMTIADGSVIPGKLVILESVRMGKFTATNVECAVLGKEAVNAPSLLGMSFLGNFKFELDASKGELTMMTIETEDKK